jgi:Ca-activated chloride channel homolog
MQTRFLASFRPALLLICGLITALTISGCSGDASSVGRSIQYVPAAESQQASRDPEGFNTESYDSIIENEFVKAMDEPQSTFSIDVDTASYANVRRILNDGSLPPKGAVRIEELINYFSYNYPEPTDEHPFAVNTEVAACPWERKHRLVRIGLKGKSFHTSERPACNLVFLLDVSGSMMEPNKLPLVKQAMKLLVKELDERDRIAIVVYAGASGVALKSTSAVKSQKINSAIDSLAAGGSTNGAAGIQLAYQIAEDNRIEKGVNRVILCTDGDFNVGTTSESELVDLITLKAQSNAFLTVLGFGDGNLKDSTMEKLADKGNGNYAYIDTLLEARKVLVEQTGGTLATIAKDVKIQIDFNPRHVQSYRLIGYENRLLENRDFRDDTKDAGEIGAGHTVTAFYEIVPNGAKNELVDVRPSEFVKTSLNGDADLNTMLSVNLRYKQPNAAESSEFQVRLPVTGESNRGSTDFNFATAVVAYGMLLRDSAFRGTADWDWVVTTAEESLGEDRHGLRHEFVQLAKTARRLSH